MPLCGHFREGETISSHNNPTRTESSVSALFSEVWKWGEGMIIVHQIKDPILSILLVFHHQSAVW